MKCWEFKKCGKEQECPAYPKFGVHCARIVGTLCDGKVQTNFAGKLAYCMQCDFYRSDNYDPTYKGFKK